MKHISEFKTDQKVEVFIDKFDYMITDEDRVELVANMKYVLLLQFVDKFEMSGKINT